MDGKYNAEASIGINDKTVLAFNARGLKPEYTDEYIDSDELKKLREMGTFFAAGYEVVKALKGKSIEELSITLEEDLVISGSIDDVAKSLLALGNIRNLHGTQPGLTLTFKGEEEPQSMYENLSEEDLANYNKVVENLSELLKECTTLVEAFSAKIKVIGSVFKI